ncbi:MAG: PLDc_N domain-containing protein [Saprospirales bacterium]|jgi:hypothetical protein|nr:PLDc_N domain-containing protein [Saprospirales bacterium]MBK8352384.1 PLDc_N domain-containing protein [Saprospirales bacterium]
MISISEIIILIVVSSIPALIAIIDIMKHEFKNNNKLNWIIVVLSVPVIGAILYYFIGRKQKETSL